MFPFSRFRSSTSRITPSIRKTTTSVSVLQKTMRAETVINLIEAPGFLENKDDEASLIKHIAAAELEAREQQVDGRMKRKMLAVRKLFEHGASRVIIADGRRDHPVADALSAKGTVIE